MLCSSQLFWTQYDGALQQLIIQKAADDLRKQKEIETTNRNNVVESRVPKLDIGGLKKGTLEFRWDL